MNVVLIGYRGCGKSTVARLLGMRLGMPVVSLDEEIVKRAGKRIPEIVAESGWEAFRTLESEITACYADKDGWIIDAGGGVVLRGENVRRLRRRGVLVWLTAAPAVLCGRIRDGTERPALKEGKTFLEEVEEVLAERTPLYAAAAHLTVETGALQPEAVAARVLELLEGERCWGLGVR
ncbi:MAG: shikimate kinase [bacterium]